MRIVLDENLKDPDLQEELQRHLPAVRIIEVSSLSDEQILVRLGEYHDCIFITRNTKHFWRQEAGARSCIICLDTPLNDYTAITDLVSQVLRQDPFTTAAKRRGCVIRLTPTHLEYYRGRNTSRVARLVFCQGSDGGHRRSTC